MMPLAIFQQILEELLFGGGRQPVFLQIIKDHDLPDFKEKF